MRLNQTDSDGDSAIAVKTVVGEDQALLLEGLVMLLERGGFAVAGVATDGPDLERKVLAHRPELVIADIRMPPTHTDEGLRAALRIRQELPEVAVMVLSQHVNREYASRLLAAGEGGLGYLLKQRVADSKGFHSDLRRICGGGTVLDPEVVAMLVRRSPLDELTERQRQVLALMAEGRSNSAIAEQLVISEKAVVKHVSRIYEQLELEPAGDDHRRVLAVIRYLATT